MSTNPPEDDRPEAAEQATSEPAAAEPDSEKPADDPPTDPLEEAEKKAAALKDQLLRTAADFDNYRKRSRREIDEARQAGRDGMLKDLLPVFDNLERAADAVNNATDVSSLASGIEMVIKQFRDTLGRLGVERIQSVGESFDPNVHEAIQQLATTDFEPGKVAGEVQGGYRQGDRLIRPAMVVVAKAPEVAAASDSADDSSAN